MPELPDLTVFAKNLRKSVLDKPITLARADNPAKLNVTADAFGAALTGACITGIERDGKELRFALTGGNAFYVHLMLNGRFSLLALDAAGGVNNRIITVGFDDGQALVVADYQALCKVSLNPKPTGVPDALSDAFTWDYFLKTIKKKSSMNIKAFLINQGIVKGIGNAYADEILYAADISPDSFAGKIPEEALRALYQAIGDVLRDAIAQIERIAPDIIAGEERSFLKVHNRNKKVTDDGEKILIDTVANKTTYYTKKQKLYMW